MLLLLGCSAFLLHTLTPRGLAGQFLDFAVPVAVGVALLAGRFHCVNAVFFIVLGGGVPGRGTGDGADGGLGGGDVSGCGEIYRGRDGMVNEVPLLRP